MYLLPVRKCTNGLASDSTNRLPMYASRLQFKLDICCDSDTINFNNIYLQLLINLIFLCIYCVFSFLVCVTFDFDNVSSYIMLYLLYCILVCVCI